MKKTVFEDKVFPRHISDLMTLMQMMVFNGTDGEEKWQTYLSLKQKEYVALGVSEYYQCNFCIEHHTKAIRKIDKLESSTLSKNISSIILYLRIDTRTITDAEKEQWISSWNKFSKRLCEETKDRAIPYLIGLAIGVARNDNFLIQFCGGQVKQLYADDTSNFTKIIGELEAVVIFMKAAVSKNRVVDKVEELLV